MNDRRTGDVVEGLILVLDDDPRRRAATFRHLALLGGWSVLGARTYECHEVTLAVRPEAIVIAPDSRGGIFPAVRDVLLEDSGIRCIIMEDELARRARSTNSDIGHRFQCAAAPTRVAHLQVLVVEEDIERRVTIARILSNVAGALVLATSSVLEARAVLEVCQPDAAIVDLKLEDGLGFEVLEALDDRGGVAMAIIPSDFVTTRQQHDPPLVERLQLLPRPLDGQHLRRVIELGLADGSLFNGPFAPVEYVQIATAGRHSIRLHCSDPAGGALGSIVMRDGRVWAAETPVLSGDAAFRQLVIRPDARVRVEPVDDPLGPANVRAFSG